MRGGGRMLEPKTIKHKGEVYYHGNNMAAMMIMFFAVGFFIGASVVTFIIAPFISP